MSINNTIVGKNRLGVCIYSDHASGQFTNNILTGCRRPIKANGDGYNRWDYNCIGETGNPTPYFINEAVGKNEVYGTMNENPLFVGEALDDPYSFIISPDGPAYHSGNILESGSVFKIDYKHDARPNPPSVGAFEPDD